METLMETLGYILLGLVLFVSGRVMLWSIVAVHDLCQKHPRITTVLIGIFAAWLIGFLAVNAEPWWL